MKPSPQSQGRRTTDKPGKRTRNDSKRSLQVDVKLEGGPRDGDIVNYGQPLPNTLVIKTERGWVDYYRKPGSSTYTYNAKGNGNGR